jgi:hypothetical protein
MDGEVESFEVNTILEPNLLLNLFKLVTHDKLLQQLRSVLFKPNSSLGSSINFASLKLLTFLCSDH